MALGTVPILEYSHGAALRNRDVKKLRRAFWPPAVKKPARASEEPPADRPPPGNFEGFQHENGQIP